METRIQTYIVQSLAASGFVLVDPSIAFELRADIFGFVRANSGYAFNLQRADLVRYLRDQPRVSVVEVQTDGSGVWKLLAYRASSPPLAHVELVTGLRVTAVREVKEERPQQPAAPKADDDGPPNHQCVERTEYFAARGIPDPVYREPDRFARSRPRF
jgi:hypothetical protein